MIQTLHPNADRQCVDVEFAVPFTHRLRFTEDVFGRDQQRLLEVLEPSGMLAPRAQVWIDENVSRANPGLVERVEACLNSADAHVNLTGPARLLPGGETVKNNARWIDEILTAIDAADLDRRSYVIVIGGGAVLDAVGFAVAVAHRGLRLVRLPTTTLAQADSGVGVKNAVNLFGKKNWKGTFHVPWAVINDTALLAKLPDRDFRAGFSEAVKVALLKSPAVFDRLCRDAARISQRDLAAAIPMIRASVEMHLRHITHGGDPFEAREARPLDYGHWSAHKLEPMTKFALRHGEAVSIGVAIDTMYSALVCGLPMEDAQRVLRCLQAFGLPVSHPLLADRDLLFDGLEEFRQHLGGRLTVTMLRGVGQPVDVHEIDTAAMNEAIDRVQTAAVPA